MTFGSSQQDLTLAELPSGNRATSCIVGSLEGVHVLSRWFPPLCKVPLLPPLQLRISSSTIDAQVVLFIFNRSLASFKVFVDSCSSWEILKTI